MILSLVEKGWAGARQATVPLAEQGHRIQHLVKGRLGREIVEIMPAYRGTGIHGLPPRWYRVVVFARVLMAPLGGRLAWVIVDNDKARRWITRWFPHLRERVVLIQERDDGSPMILRDGRAVDPAVLRQVAA